MQQLPAAIDGVPLRHAVEVRHESFKCAPYLALARKHRVTTVFTDSDDYPSFADLTGEFVYVRTMRADKSLPEAAHRRRWRNWRRARACGATAASRRRCRACEAAAGARRAARRVSVLHQRRQGEGAGRRDGAARSACAR